MQLIGPRTLEIIGEEEETEWSSERCVWYQFIKDSSILIQLKWRAQTNKIHPRFSNLKLTIFITQTESLPHSDLMLQIKLKTQKSLLPQMLQD